ncbi:hybrid sensor histidine kinase/response regulator [Jannaschia sp. CCS1]|uniref:hybrid sensor histidine kinase/response regulator n=1 Tax=Jannaschia sp. (strain CCS1) TaxID=290400 RepID=UPI000053AC03|nr:PAS-domain containing protein [Jannaschia sp. CCS1]ABD56930.1 PAS/PAC sensor hybrid histidine kinase [Jannaschia sp. CCS1]
MARDPKTDTFTRAGLNLIQQALSIYDADLRLAVSNRPFQEMFDLPRHLVTPGARFDETIAYLVARGEYGEVEDEASFVQTRVDQALAFVPHYLERVRANGRAISIEGSPLPEGGWVTVYTDITAVKRQEALLRARSEELSDQVLSHTEELALTNRRLEATISQLQEAKATVGEMEARTRLVTEMTPAHIAHIDARGIYTFTNRRLSSLLQGRANDIIGLSFEEALGEDTAALLRPTLARASAGEPAVLEFSEPASGRRIRTAFTPDEHSDGGVYLLSTDVTQETQARTALEQTHKRELAAQLTSGLAHDFANLLTIILGLQARLEKLPLPHGAHELTGATRMAVRRGGLLLDKIANMTSTREIRAAPVVVQDFLAGFTPLAQATLPDAVALSVRCNVAHTALMLDAGSLQDGLLNLVLNARDGIGAEEGQITLILQDVKDTWLEITVEDTGRGFSDAALDQALNPFFTTKGDEGSGLGLTMVYDLVKLAGGTLRLSNSASGARVMLRLPLRPAQADARPRLILLVDDMSEIRAQVRDLLTDLGHQVIEAATAEEAQTLADLPGLDWVLSDIHLGEVDGVAVLGHIADRHPALRLSLMTSLPPDDPLFMAGAARWPVLRKPIDVSALAALLMTEVTP